MKLVGELKNKVEKTEDLDEAKKIIEEVGMELSDEEMDNVAGGGKGGMGRFPVDKCLKE